MVRICGGWVARVWGGVGRVWGADEAGGHGQQSPAAGAGEKWG